MERSIAAIWYGRNGSEGVVLDEVRSLPLLGAKLTKRLGLSATPNNLPRFIACQLGSKKPAATIRSRRCGANGRVSETGRGVSHSRR